MTASTSTTPGTGPDATYDNQGQYTRAGILRYERVFGTDYVSTGGHATTEDLCARLGDSLKPGVRVLDVGSGIGGAAFHLARKYGARVVGIDLAGHMIDIANERTAQYGLGDSVTSILGDVLTTDFPEKFDIVWSRDALMHVPDKARLFSRLFSLLNPGGRIVITDYARGKTPGSPEFEAYIAKTGYSVVEPEQYGQYLRDAGFTDVVVDDATGKFIEILRDEVRRLQAERTDFVGAFSEADLSYIIERWEMKVRFCQAGDMKWGIYLGTKA
jgi:phosphoethanolamine N-methyltransferase